MSLIHLKQGIPELFICLLCVFSCSMTTSLTLIKEGLGWVVSFPFVLINGGCSAQTQGVSEIKYPAHTVRDRANAGAWGEIGKPSVTLATLLVLSFPQIIPSVQLFPLLGWFEPKCLLSKNIALRAAHSFLTMETPCKQIPSIDLNIHSTGVSNKLFSVAEDILLPWKTLECYMELQINVFSASTLCCISQNNNTKNAGGWVFLPCSVNTLLKMCKINNV